MSREDAEEAFRTILRWIGEDPEREGLVDTPRRVVEAHRAYFRGYLEDPAEHLRTTFAETGGYDEMVLLRNIPFRSHCEHHMAPIIGRAWIGYVPAQRVVCISKLARVVDGYSRRLQIQERFTTEVANAIQSELEPKGVAVFVKAEHHCISGRGVQKHGVDLSTSRMIGCFKDDPMLRQEFLATVSADLKP
ncbi:GTP cyclohydrolase I FolE [Bradyrhizobium guangdongense]